MRPLHLARMVIADPNSPYAAASHALVLCAEASLQPLAGTLESLGYRVTAAADPYQLLLELLERPLVYDAVVLSLSAIYREELGLIATLRARVPHIEVLLAHTDGRHASLAEAMRLGVSGLLGEEGLYRTSQATMNPVISSPAPSFVRNETPPAESSEAEEDDSIAADGDPLLTADELRALLQDQPTFPPK